MGRRLIAVVAVAALTFIVCACSSSSSCFDARPAAGSAHVLGGVSPLSTDAGARDASDDGWRVGCQLLNCGPGGVCGPQTDSTGVTKAVCFEPC